MTHEEKTIYCRNLQNRLRLHTERAEMDREANGGQYTSAGLEQLGEAAKLQILLSKHTDGNVSRLHRAEGERLIQLLHTHSCRPAAASASAPRKAASAAPAGGKPAAKKRADSELPENFDPANYILKPSGDSLDDIKSNPELIARVRSAIDGSGNFHAEFPNATRGWKSGSRQLQNFFLFGPPATGKSHLCRAVANHLEKHYPGESAFYLISALTISSKYQGQTGRILNAIFEDAAKYKFSVICMDEIEEICFERDKDVNKVNYTTHFLELLDGIAGKSKSMFIACSNFPWIVDRALLSRLHVRALLDYPCAGDIVQYLRASEERCDWLGADKTSADAMAEKVAQAASARGFSYRNLETMCAAIREQGEAGMRRAYPGGCAELSHVIPLSEDEIFTILNSIASDYDEEEHQRYLAYDDTTRNKTRAQ